MILSRGSLRGDLVALAAALEVTEDVALPGFVRNPFAYMPRASVFALSSIWGGMGLVLVEALAGSCPVVSTDCYAGPTEILRPGGEMGPALWFPSATMRHRRLPSSPIRQSTLAQTTSGEERGMGFSAEQAAERYERLISVANAPNASPG